MTVMPKVEIPNPSGYARRDWTLLEVRGILDLPFPKLLFQAQSVQFNPAEIQIFTLLSIETGGCPEDCAHCSQSAPYDTGLNASKLMQVSAVLAEAQVARGAGATRFCMGAAWTSPQDRNLDTVCAIIEGVKALGLETCATLGRLNAENSRAGLDVYNHNVDTLQQHYGTIVTTRSYRSQLNTLSEVRAAGINVCCGGIVGLVENSDDQVSCEQSGVRARA